MPFVSFVSAQCTVTTSDAAASAWTESARATPSRAARSSSSERLQATTGIPKAFARVTTSRPIAPRPMTPSVRPARPRAFP